MADSVYETQSFYTPQNEASRSRLQEALAGRFGRDFYTLRFAGPTSVKKEA